MLAGPPCVDIKAREGNVGKKKFFWFLKGVLALAWFISLWYLLAEVLELADRPVVWVIATLSLCWALWGLVMVNAWLSIVPYAMGIIGWLVFGAEAAIVIASAIYGLTHMRKFPTHDWTPRIFFSGVLPLPVFVWTINLGWEISLLAASVVLLAQLALLYLPMRGEHPRML